ncbi:hypothetical protein EMCRGX_G019921 [Ephydatia muelleri]
MPSRNRKKRCKQRAEYLQKREDILSQENKAKARERYKADPEKKKASVRDTYKADPEKKKASVRDTYKADPEKKKASVRDTYNANAVSKRAAKRQRYQEGVEENRAAKRQRYQEGVEENRAAKRQRYQEGVEENRAAKRQRYQEGVEENRAAKRQRYQEGVEENRAAKRQRYQEGVEENRAAKRQRYQEGVEENRAANRRIYRGNSATIKAARRSRYWKGRRTTTTTQSYSLFEPNSRTLAEYGVRLEKAILRDSELLSEVNNAFCNSHPLLAQKVVTRSARAAVSKISADALLAKALSVRRSQAGSLLKTIRKVNAKKLQESDILVGHRFHIAGAEPYFFDNSYTHTKQHGAIPVDLNGRWLKKSGKNFLMTLKERRSRKHIHPPSSQLLPPPALASPPAAALPPPALAPPTSSSAAPANASPTITAAALPPPTLAPPPAAALPPASASPTTSSSAASASPTAAPTTAPTSASPPPPPELDPEQKKAPVRDSYKADPEKKASVRDSYKAHPEKKKASVRDSYKAHPEKKKASVRDSYKAHPEKKKASVRDSYKAHPEKKKASVRDSYNADIESKQCAKRQRYQEDLEENRAAKRQRYQEDVEENRAAKRQKYEDNSTAIKASERNRYWNDPAVRLASAGRTRYRRGHRTTTTTQRCSAAPYRPPPAVAALPPPPAAAELPPPAAAAAAQLPPSPAAAAALPSPPPAEAAELPPLPAAAAAELSPPPAAEAAAAALPLLLPAEAAGAPLPAPAPPPAPVLAPVPPPPLRLLPPPPAWLPWPEPGCRVDRQRAPGTGHNLLTSSYPAQLVLFERISLQGRKLILNTQSADTATSRDPGSRMATTSSEMTASLSPQNALVQDTLHIASVKLRILSETLEPLQEFEGANMQLTCTGEEPSCCRLSFNTEKEQVFEAQVKDLGHVYHAGANVVVFRVADGSAAVTLDDCGQLITFLQARLAPATQRKKQSMFTLRTDDACAVQYFQFYGFLSQQQNMLQDYIRTATYQNAMIQNQMDFQDKVVLDVGAGSGILSFFAVQAGAQLVYAVEASSMAVHCMDLVKGNHLSNKVVVIAGKIEEITLPEKVDIIVSEPMGYMLYNERMLESYLHAKKFLKPGGLMYPSDGTLFAAPFMDDALYMEHYAKAYFWSQTSFHGVDLSFVRSSALEEYFRQPVVDTFDTRILLASPANHVINFSTAHESDLHRMTIPVHFKLFSTGTVHGLAFWFDVCFRGSQQTVWLSTAPSQPLTHWYQVRCLFRNPIVCRCGQEITGFIYMVANERQSYDIKIELAVCGTNNVLSGSYDLKNPCFRYMGATPVVSSGSHQTMSPTESYWNSVTGQTVTTATSPVQSLQTPEVLNGTVMSPNLHMYQQIHGGGGGHTQTHSGHSYYSAMQNSSSAATMQQPLAPLGTGSQQYTGTGGHYYQQHKGSHQHQKGGYKGNGYPILPRPPL